MSATINYNYSLTFRVPPTIPGNLPAKRVFRSNLLESTRISSSGATPSNTNNAQGNKLSVSACVSLASPPRLTTHHHHHPWQWRLTLTEEPQPRNQGERGECKGREGEVEEATEVDLSVELRGLSMASSLPSSGPFGGFLLQYKSFSIVAKNTRFTLVSKTIDSSSALSLQNVVFIWQNKVLMAAASDSDCKSGNDCGSGSDNDSDDDGGHGGRLKRYDVTLARLYAHQAVLHQYPYFRRKLPLRSPSSLGGSPCVLMPRKLLVRDFSRPVVRLVLGWMYTRKLDITKIGDVQTAAPNDQPFTSNSKQQDGDEARVTWMDVFQLADNMELPELRVRALNMMRQTLQA
ncbi:hypothetical protein F5H01DRAFT_411695 [Linnemannia elongata]|nr:hypothetical protein F5H01DRAFT_411695 [Linnemannia elongata]